MEPIEALPAFRQFLAAATRLRPTSIDYSERLNEVILNAIAPTASADQLHALVAVAKRPEFAAIHRPLGGGPWSLFKAVVAYEKENPVERVSRITASLLLTLNEVYESTARSAAAIR